MAGRGNEAGRAGDVTGLKADHSLCFFTSLGLKEAKDLADEAPSIIKESVPTDEANEVKAKLEEAGATVTLK